MAPLSTPSYSCKCQCASFREHALGVTVSMSAMPTRKPVVVETTQREQRWERDMPAYKRLRDNGLQPKHIDGSGDMETRAIDSLEVEKGHLFGKDLAMARDAYDVVKAVKGA